MTPEQLTPEQQAIAYQGSFVVTAITMIVNCLRNNGALGPTQVEDAIRATLKHPSARRARRNISEKLRIMRAKSCCAHTARYRVGELYFPHFVDV